MTVLLLNWDTVIFHMLKFASCGSVLLLNTSSPFAAIFKFFKLSNVLLVNIQSDDWLYDEVKFSIPAVLFEKITREGFMGVRRFRVVRLGRLLSRMLGQVVVRVDREDRLFPTIIREFMERLDRGALLWLNVVRLGRLGKEDREGRVLF